VSDFPLACADFTFPLLSHEHSLDLIAMLGLDGVDVGLFEGRSHLQPSDQLGQPEQAGAELARKCRERGLKLADVFLQTDPDFSVYPANHPEADRRAKARDWFERTLDYANAAGSRHVTCLPGVSFESEPFADSWARCVDELAWRVERSRAAGLVFGVEGHVGSIVPEPESLKQLVEAVAGLTLTLDYTHFTRAGLPDSAVEPLVRHASHFHVRGARQDRLQAPFDENKIDYGQVLRAMREVGYAGWLGIEYVWIDWEHCNECDNLSETIRFRDFLRTA
jgi:sugar phosphate isomerase/epimerase